MLWAGLICASCLSDWERCACAGWSRRGGHWRPGWACWKKRRRHRRVAGRGRLRLCFPSSFILAIFANAGRPFGRLMFDFQWPALETCVSADRHRSRLLWLHLSSSVHLLASRARSWAAWCVAGDQPNWRGHCVPSLMQARVCSTWLGPARSACSPPSSSCPRFVCCLQLSCRLSSACSA